MIPYLTYSLIGIAAGLLSGTFGVGGGIVIVPALVLFAGLSQYAANGTSLVALLLPVGILGALEYYKAGKIGPDNVKAGLIIAIGLFIGAYFGARFAVMLPETILKKSFAVFLVLIAFKMWFSK